VVQGVHFDTPTLQYSLQDLISTVGVTILLSYGWSVLRRNTYEKGRALQESNQRIQEQHHELEQQNHDLFTLNLEKDELLGIVSHDLKNPLAGMKGLLEILHRDDEQLSPEFRQKLFVQMNDGVDRMFGIVKNLLDIHRLESGSVGYAIVKLNVKLLLAQVVQFYHEIATQKHLSLQYLPNDQQPLCVYADAQALTQVLDNLLSNAIKYSPLGKTVWLSACEKEETVQIIVQDEGEGISESEQSRLFQKFARLSTKPTGGEHSTGLGLSIVKKLVTSMNGKVWCESKQGEGATFIVELPKAIEIAHPIRH
jgi:signal transduction histidine kinase